MRRLIRRRRRDPRPVQPWTVHQLRLFVGAAAVGVVLLVVGAGVAAVLLARTGHPAGRGATAGSPTNRRDAIAAAPMMSVPQSAATAGETTAAASASAVRLPYSTRTGPRGVPAGYAHTGWGAAAQLAAIETTALTSVNPDEADAIHTAWSADPTSQTGWDVTTQLGQFLDTIGAYHPDRVSVTADPGGVQTKGSDGPNWVVACVLLKVTGQASGHAASVAYGHCERMTWSEPQRRWVIAPGPVPAPAPSTWPNTALAAQAGWRPVAAAKGE